MSNIFDALGKKREEEGGSGEGPPPFEPVLHVSLESVGEIDFQLGRELEPLRERIDLELPRTGRKVFGVSGSVRGEGATTIAASLARSMARASGARALLVDADFARGPGSLARHVAPEDEPIPGLVELLAGRIDLSQAIAATEEPSLHVITTGREPVRPMDLVGSQRMRQFLDDMGQLYRAVIVDCPPILDHPESPMLGALTSGVALVVRAHQTRREVVQRALALLQGARCPVLGVILNERRYPIPGFLYRRL
ncbi:MAG: AAA family ATPase [Candidatus Eisenbacteria bacterium]|nr:AAA family ATPase [Candidatus Latescibacterota bacterium]MBD3303448.1 AAA family ATPase [Candidatus Eisenbacteria bacterium]